MENPPKKNPQVLGKLHFASPSNFSRDGLGGLLVGLGSSQRRLGAARRASGGRLSGLGIGKICGSQATKR